jgi:hypothetical protein
MKTSPKIRKSWGVLSPVTRKIESKKAYTRKQKCKCSDLSENL